MAVTSTVIGARNWAGTIIRTRSYGRSHVAPVAGADLARHRVAGSTAAKGAVIPAITTAVTARSLAGTIIRTRNAAPSPAGTAAGVDPLAIASMVFPGAASLHRGLRFANQLSFAFARSDGVKDIDAFSRKVIGWALDKHLEARLAIEAAR